MNELMPTSAPKNNFPAVINILRCHASLTEICQLTACTFKEIQGNSELKASCRE
jgi:hypothetical protein